MTTQRCPPCLYPYLNRYYSDGLLLNFVMNGQFVMAKESTSGMWEVKFRNPYGPQLEIWETVIVHSPEEVLGLLVDRVLHGELQSYDDWKKKGDLA